MRGFLLFFGALVALGISLPQLLAQDDKQEAKEEILTVYDITGQPIFQSQDNPGWHRVMDSVTLSSGLATVTLNTSTANGGQDVSFISSFSYHGHAWALNLNYLGNAYTVWPRTDSKFQVRSSDANDSSTVYYLVEGQ